MGMDKATLEAIQRQKQYEERLEELRRQSAAKTEKSLENLQADVDEYSNKFDTAHEHFVKVTDDRARQLGMESFSTLIMQMRPSLEAYAKMAGAYRSYLLSKIHLAIASNINYQSSPGFILEGIAEGTRWAQANIERYTGLLEDLPPVFVPYLAEVQDNGVLSVSLDVPNTQANEEDRRAFVNQYQHDFQTTVHGWINNSQTLDGEVMTIDNTAEGPKIRIGPDGATPRYMTKEEFCEYRARVVQPALEQHFTVDFQPETSRNMPGM